MKASRWWAAVATVATLSILLTGCSSQQTDDRPLPAGFASLAVLESGIQLDIRYFTDNNFLGRPVTGYEAADCVLTDAAAAALVTAQQLATEQGYSLKVYDCYRPQRAVNDFVRWAADPDDTRQQHRFYPAVPKNRLFELGYIAERSGHSRGSTVDLTLVPTGSRQPLVSPLADRYDCRLPVAGRYPDNSLDMGTGYDCFDELSHTDNSAISGVARQNRQRLRSIMEAAGFTNYAQEWWHYTLDNEPYTNRYFDFPIR